MGCFSWKFSNDQETSIWIAEGSAPSQHIIMLSKDSTYHEHAYEGYGKFGGKDFYQLLAEMNNLATNGDTDHDRQLGIDLMFSDGNNCACGKTATEKGILMPILLDANQLTKHELSNLERLWADYPAPEQCPNQGFFYIDEEEDEDYWEY